MPPLGGGDCLSDCLEAGWLRGRRAWDEVGSLGQKAHVHGFEVPPLKGVVYLDGLRRFAGIIY